MLLGGDGLALGGNLFEGAADAETRVARFDHIVDVTFGCGLVGIGEEALYSFSFWARKAFGSASFWPPWR